LTRKKGKRATVTVCTDTGYSFDVETGEQAGGEVEYGLRWVVKEPTKYSRVLRANAVEGNIGDTTFIMWTGDTKRKFDRLDGEDFITYEGERYDVVTFVVEDTSVVVTAKQVVRT